MKARFLLASLPLLSCTTPRPPACTDAPCRFVVLHTNDHHGHPVAFDHFPAKQVGGLPARLTLIAAERQREKNLLVLDAGDINTGRPESMLFDAKPDIEGYNAIGYDAFAVGNHELTRSLDTLTRQASWARFPFLTANVTLADGSPLPGIRPYVIRELDGFRVAILGLTTSEVAQTGNPEVTSKLHIEDPVTAARRLVPRLRREADFVIALAHLGLDDSNGSRRLAREVEGLDLIVDGHSHTKIEKPVFERHAASGREVAIVQAWQWGLEVGRTSIAFQRNAPTVVRFESLGVNLNPDDPRIAPDEKLAAHLEGYVADAEKRLSETLATLPANLDNGRVRLEETPIGNLVADACLSFTRALGAHFSLQNAGSVRMPLPQGTVTRKSVVEALPFDNTIVLLSLTGQEVQRLFDFTATLPRGKGAFPIVAGVSLKLDAQAKRAFDVRIQGKPLDPAATYRVATNSYLAAGGDGYAILKVGTNKYDTAYFIRDAVAELLKKGGAPARTDGRLVLQGYAD